MNQSISADRPDLLIVGGGIIGLSSARAALQAGLKVALVERGEPARQASWAGAGVLRLPEPWQKSPVATLTGDCEDDYAALCDELQRETGLDCGFARAGSLFLPPLESEFHDWLADTTEEHRYLQADELDKLLGPLSPGGEALFLPGRATIRPPHLCRSLLAWLRQQNNFSLHTGVDVRSLDIRDGRVQGIDTDSGKFAADACLIAAGPWSAQLVPEAGLDIAPMRGQILAWQTGLSLPPMNIARSDGYAVLRSDGVVLVGSTVEDVGFDAEPTAQARTLLLNRGGEMFPWLRDKEPDHHWAGLRPGAARPLVGRLPLADNLWINAGHFRDGFTCALRSAQLLTALLLDRTPPCDPAPYAP